MPEHPEKHSNRDSGGSHLQHNTLLAVRCRSIRKNVPIATAAALVRGRQFPHVGVWKRRRREHGAISLA